MLEAIAASPPAVALRVTPWLYGLVSGLHVVGISALFGAILALDLRLLLCRRARDWRSLVAAASPVAVVGLALAMVTGSCLFAVRPLHYLGNALFIIKLALIVVGAGNAMAFHHVLGKNPAKSPGRALRSLALVSVSTWTAAIFSGRFIAFT